MSAPRVAGGTRRGSGRTVLRPVALAAAFLVAGGGAVSEASAESSRTFVNARFAVAFGEAGLVSLRAPGPGAGPDVIRPGSTLGHVVARYRMNGQPEREFSTGALSGARTIKSGGEGSREELLLVYNGSGWYDYDAELELTERFRVEAGRVVWTIHFRNVTDKPVEIAELRLALPFAAAPPGGPAAPYVLAADPAGRPDRVELRPSAGGEGLVLVPLAKCPLFEPAQNERNFAAARLERVEWRDGDVVVSLHSPGGSGLLLTPKFTPGDEVTYGFEMSWRPAAAALTPEPARPGERR